MPIKVCFFYLLNLKGRFIALDKVFDFLNLKSFKEINKSSDNYQFYEEQKAEVKEENINQYLLEEFIKSYKKFKKF